LGDVRAEVAAQILSRLRNGAAAA